MSNEYNMSLPNIIAAEQEAASAIVEAAAAEEAARIAFLENEREEAEAAKENK